MSQLHHGENVVFLGDAAHALIPSTGEGMNAALEDVRKMEDAERLEEEERRLYEALGAAPEDGGGVVDEPLPKGAYDSTDFWSR